MKIICRNQADAQCALGFTTPKLVLNGAHSGVVQ
jgi:hypothetical protein